METKENIAKLRAGMVEEQLDAYVVPSADPHRSEYVGDHWRCRQWISGFSGSTGTAAILVDQAGLWTDGRYFIQAGAGPTENEIDGKDIWPILSGAKGAESPHEEFFYYNCDNLQAVFWQHWKLYLPRTKEMVPWWQKNKGLTDLKPPMLFDLSTDINETTNVAAENPEVLKRMLVLAEKAYRQLGDYETKGSKQRATGDSRELK